MPPFIVQLITKFLTYTDGYKTIFSAIGFIGYSIYLLASTDPPNVNGAIEAFLTALGLIGLGHKLAKNTAAQGIADGPVTPDTLIKPVDQVPQAVITNPPPPAA